MGKREWQWWVLQGVGCTHGAVAGHLWFSGAPWWLGAGVAAIGLMYLRLATWLFPQRAQQTSRGRRKP